MKRKLTVLLALTAILWACNDSLPTMDPSKKPDDEKTEKKSDDKSDKKEDDKEKTKPQLLNDISLETEGDVEVYRAFLGFQNGTLASTNTTSLGKDIILNLNITGGWKEEDGRVSLGAYEKISTDKGRIILEENDLFGNKTLAPDDSKMLTLYAGINEKKEDIEYYVVDFKVWDKNGNGVIKGSYKFYVE